MAQCVIHDRMLQPAYRALGAAAVGGVEVVLRVGQLPVLTVLVDDPTISSIILSVKPFLSRSWTSYGAAIAASPLGLSIALLKDSHGPLPCGSQIVWMLSIITLAIHAFGHRLGWCTRAYMSRAMIKS